MKNRTKIIILMAGILIVGIVIGCVIFGFSETVHKLLDDTNASISMIVSIFALIIALVTYFSIDAVDQKNRMDNNVLEMDCYNVSYPEMIKNLNVAGAKEYQEALIKKVVAKRKINSCMDFSDWIQDIIDYLIWFAYLDRQNGWDKETKEKFVKSLKDELRNYDSVGSGIRLLFSENIRLIENVLLYQDRRVSEDYTLSSLEEVRYTLIPNPIAKTIYYDYLGLDYRKYISGKMQNCVNEKEFTKEYFEAWKKTTDVENRQECLFWIEKAVKSFEHANEIAKDDMIWLGYLSYNLVRCEIMQYLLSENRDKEQLNNIKNNLAECVRIRNNNCLLINEEGYLKTKFTEGRDRAEYLKKAFEEVF